jgi:hypothetical protein
MAEPTKLRQAGASQTSPAQQARRVIDKLIAADRPLSTAELVYAQGDLTLLYGLELEDPIGDGATYLTDAGLEDKYIVMG